MPGTLLSGKSLFDAVAETSGTAPLKQGLQSLMNPGMSGIRGFSTLGGAGATAASMGVTAAAAFIAGNVVFDASLYLGSYIEAIPALFE